MNEHARNEHAANAAKIIRARGKQPIDAAIVLGTGLAGLADEAKRAVSIDYADLPGFPRVGVSGHAGRLVIGDLGGRHVAMMTGRGHYYENGDANAMRGALSAFKAAGIGTLLLTNACGSLRPDWRPGAITIISDHINYAGVNPLIGESSDARFVTMNDAYDPALRGGLSAAAAKAGVPVHEGVYLWYSGPSFETPAEIRMARVLGADIIGMSTAPEVILARFLGLRVAALALITNLAAGIEGARPSHAETKEVGARGAEAMKKIVRGFLASPGPGK